MTDCHWEIDIELARKYLRRALDFAEESDCISRKVGAIVGDVNEFHIISFGWNGSPRQKLRLGCKDKGVCNKRLHGFESGEGHEHCMAIHAEVHALMDLMRKTQTPLYTVYDRALFVTYLPCANCAKLIIQAGIIDVYYLLEYPDRTSKDLFAMYGVNLHKVKL